MSALTLFSTTPYVIIFNWTDVTDDTKRGRDPITYYEVSFKAIAADSWTTLTT